jgi:PAS domain S-box-containing protein
MVEANKARILLDLVDSGEFQRLAAALHREGFEVVGPARIGENHQLRSPQWLDDEILESGAEFALVDADLWGSVAFEIRHSMHSFVLVVLVDADGEAQADGFVRLGAFDGLLRGGDGWEAGVATYFQVLAGLWKRFSGTFGHLERRYENLVHALPDIVYELDEAGRFTFVNNSIRLLGYEPQELTGRHFSVLLDEEDARNVDRDRILGWFKGARTGPGLSPKLFNERRTIDRKTENLELRFKQKSRDGRNDLIGQITSYGEVTAAGEYQGAGGFLGTVGVIRDITLRRRSEDMLRKLYQAVDQLSAAILIVDMDFSIEYANPAFFRMTGHEPQELIEHSVFSCLEIDPKRIEEVSSLVREGFDVRDELPLVASSGERLWTAWHLSPVREPSGDVSHAIAVCEDISNTRAMADLLRAAKEEAERADRAKSDFLASMGHELKGPLASILAAARLIEMGGGDAERRAGTVIASAQGLLDLLGDILDFVRFETGSATMRQLTFPLSTFVMKTCEPWKVKAEAKGLGFAVGQLTDWHLVSDPDRLGRAFSALLSNAVNYTEQGLIRVEARVERKAGNVPYLDLTVQDSGQGIALEDQTRIFHPFVQLGSPFVKTVGGTGIGLSLARNIVRALGGEIRLTSEPGKGSLFTILVPAGELETVDVIPAISGSGPRVYRILVVDDNEINRDYMAILLGNAGHRVDRAESGAEALRLLEAVQPDAAVLDIQMPGMSGIELCRKVRGYRGGRYDSTMPLIALTAFGPEDVYRSEADFDRVFTKPADIPDLLAALDGSIEARETESPQFFMRRWEGRPTAGAACLAKAEVDLPAFFDALSVAARDGNREAIRLAAQSIAHRLTPVGANSLVFAMHRFSLAASRENHDVLAARAERLYRRWDVALAAANDELKGLEDR